MTKATLRLSLFLNGVSITTPASDISESLVAVISIPAPVVSLLRSQIIASSLFTFLVRNSISIVFPSVEGFGDNGFKFTPKLAPALRTRELPTQPDVLFQLNPEKVAE